MGQEGAYYWKSGRLYQKIVQAIFLFEVDTWFVTPCIVTVLGGFNHRVVWSIVQKQPQKHSDRIWAYHLLEEDMQVARMEEMETYISRHHNMYAKFILMRPILDLLLET